MYFLPERVLRAFAYEQQMKRVAASPVVDPDEWRLPPVVEPEPVTEPEEITPLLPEQIEAVDRMAEKRERDIMHAAIPIASADDLDRYREQAHREGKAYPCRTEDCLHTAPAPGDACPVCADKRQTPPYIGDAA